MTRDTMRPVRLGVALVAFLMVLPVAGAVLPVDGLPEFNQVASPAYNMFLNSEMEACAPVAVETPGLLPPEYGGSTPCAPWLLRTVAPAAENAPAHSTTDALYLRGHGGTTSLRINYDARDGDLYLGQYMGLERPAAATPWRAIQQVTFDYRADDVAAVGFAADVIRPDGSRELVHVDGAPLHVQPSEDWKRTTLYFTDLGDLRTPRSAVMSLWLVVYGDDTADGVRFDVDNIYATNVYLDPYVER